MNATERAHETVSYIEFYFDQTNGIIIIVCSHGFELFKTFL